MWCLYNDHTAFSYVAVIHQSKKKKKEQKLKEQKIWIYVRAGGDYHGKKKIYPNSLKDLFTSTDSKSKASLQSIFCSDILKTEDVKFSQCDLGKGECISIHLLHLFYDFKSYIMFLIISFVACRK